MLESSSQNASESEVNQRDSTFYMLKLRERLQIMSSMFASSEPQVFEVNDSQFDPGSVQIVDESPRVPVSEERRSFVLDMSSVSSSKESSPQRRDSQSVSEDSEGRPHKMLVPIELFEGIHSLQDDLAQYANTENLIETLSQLELSCRQMVSTRDVLREENSRCVLLTGPFNALQ